MAGGVRTVVLRANMTEAEAAAAVERKKTAPFRSLLSLPKREDVHVHSLRYCLECVTAVSGRYSADYYRRATHGISVGHEVRGVEVAGAVFEARPRSGLAKKFSGSRARNRIDIDLEEHVFVEEEGELFLDHHGREVRFPYKTDSKSVEGYPQRALKGADVRRPEITAAEAVERLKTALKKPVEGDVRDLTDEFSPGPVSEIYVPVFEARLVGPRKKVRIMRVDAVRRRIV